MEFTSPTDESHGRETGISSLWFIWPASIIHWMEFNCTVEVPVALWGLWKTLENQFKSKGLFCRCLQLCRDCTTSCLHNSTDIIDFVVVKMVRLDDLLRLFLDYEGNEEPSLQKVCLTKGLTENKSCLFCSMTVTKMYCLMAAWLNNLECDNEQFNG